MRMTKAQYKTIVTNNEMIARYLGFEIVTRNIKVFGEMTQWRCKDKKAPLWDKIDGMDAYKWSFQQLQFHTSLDWLNEVMKYIESKGYNFHICSDPWLNDDNTKDYSRIQHITLILNRKYSVVINSCGHGKDDRTDRLKSVYIAIVEFIKKDLNDNPNR